MNLQQLLEAARQATDNTPRMVLRGWSPISAREVEKGIYRIRLSRYRDKSDKRGAGNTSNQVRLGCKV